MDRYNHKKRRNSPNISFDDSSDDSKDNNNQNKKINNEINNNLFNNIKDSLDKNLSDFIMNFTQCFICLCKAKEPLTCPKCNNFACKQCLENYFKDQMYKECPICKIQIYKLDLKPSKIIKEIETLLNLKDNKDYQIKKLNKLIKEKEEILSDNKEIYLNNLKNKLFKIQDNLKDYRKEYQSFISKWEKQIFKLFDIYEKKIESLIYDLDFNIEKYNEEFSKKSKYIIDNENNEKYKNKDEKIISLIKKIISMDRKYFNENKDGFLEHFPKNLVIGIKTFFERPLLIVPNMANYNIGFIDFSKDDFGKKNKKKKDFNFHIGEYKIKYNFNSDYHYSSLCTFSYDKDTKGSFFVIQKKIIDNKITEIIPMQLVEKNTYEANVKFDELKEVENSLIRMETTIQNFTLINEN